MQTFSRRNLIKAAGLSSLFGMLGLSFDPLQAAEHAKGVKLNPKMKDGWHYGHCRMCMRGTCPNMYRVENGIAVESWVIRQRRQPEERFAPRVRASYKTRTTRIA